MIMTKRSVSISLLLLAAALFTEGCQDRRKAALVRSELIDGIQHVFNSGEPLRGRIPLEVSEVLRIDPDRISPEDPPLFELAVKDRAGNIYLADVQNVRVYKFDPQGALVSRFLAKGQGPGEFPRFGDLQIVGDHAWVIGNWPMKIAKFSLDGRFVDEWAFPTFRNFYLRTLVVGEDRFLTVGYRDLPGGQDRLRVSVLMNSREEFLVRYHEDAAAGIFRFRTGVEGGPAIASTDPLIAADIHHAYDLRSGVVYVCINREYKIWSKGPDGTTRLIIHRTSQGVALDDAAKDRMLDEIAPQLPLEARDRAKQALPGAMNAIRGISVLSNGLLAVKRFTGLHAVEIDLIDGQGRLLHTAVPSAAVPDLGNVTIFGRTIGLISEAGDKSIYVEYRWKSPRGLFE
jgi:hypothetical protein